MDLKKAQLFEAYSQLMQLQDEHKVFATDLPLPELLVVGEQSSGKSSLLEFYIGFPCNFVAAGTGTRCPIRFHLSTNLPAGVPANVSKVGNDLVPNDQVAIKIEEAMVQISNMPGGFSSAVLPVYIYNAQMNAVLLDLPGMIPNPQDDAHAQKVLDIITEKMNANKNCSIIALLESNRHWESAVTIGQLNKLRDQKKLHLDWHDRAIVVGTKLDAVSPSSAENLVSGLQTKEGIRANYMAVSLNPEMRNRTKQTYALWAQYLTEIEAKEQHVIKKLQQGVPNWNNLWNDHLGLANTKCAIEDLLMQSLEKCLGELIHDMQAKLEASKTEMNSTNENIDLLDPEKRKQTYLLMYEKYMSRLRRLYGGDSFLLKPAFGHECVLRKETPWKYFSAVDKIKQDFGNEIPKLQVASFEAKLFGGSHLRRLTSFFRVLIAAAEYEDYTLEQLLLFDGGVKHNNQWDYEKIVFEGVKFMIKQWFHDGLTWLGEEVKASLAILHKYVVEDMPELPFAISKIFQESLEIFTKTAVAKLQDEVAKKCAFQIHDLPWLMSVTPSTISSVPDDQEEINVDDTKMKDFIAKQQQVDSKQVVKLITHRFPFYLKANRYEDNPEALKTYLNQHIKQLCTTLKILLLIDIEFGIEARISQKIHNANMSDGSGNKKFAKESLALRLVQGVWQTDDKLDNVALQRLKDRLAKWTHVRDVLEDAIQTFQSHATFAPTPASNATDGGIEDSLRNGQANSNTLNSGKVNAKPETFTTPLTHIKSKKYKVTTVDDLSFQQLLSAEGKNMLTDHKGKDSVLQCILHCTNGIYQDIAEIRKVALDYAKGATTLPTVAKSAAALDKLATDKELGVEFLTCFGAMADRPIYVYTAGLNILNCYEVTSGRGPAIGLALTHSNCYQVVTDR